MKHPGRDERDQTDVDLEAINASSLYAMYCVFATAAPLPRDGALAEVEDAVAATGVTVRGFYDIGGFRADADLMVWLLADDAAKLQAAYHAIRRSVLGASLDRSGRASACTGRRSSTARTCPAASPASHRAPG